MALDNVKNYVVTIEYVAMDNTEHTIQAKFNSLPLALTKAKATCMKNDVRRVKSVLVKEL